MQINSINNTHRNPNFNAKLTIVGDKALFTKEQVSSLTKKAEKLGNNSDMVIVGVTRCVSRTPQLYIPAEYSPKDKELGSHTLLAAVCHTFFGINNPPSFIQKIGDIYGSRDERAQKSFDILDGYLDNIGTELRK